MPTAENYPYALMQFPYDMMYKRSGKSGQALVTYNSLFSEATFTRSSAARYFDASGVLQSASTNVPRFGSLTLNGLNPGLVIEGARTNSIRNNSMAGAIVGTPGTPPTNWSSSPVNHGGLTRTIVGTGTLKGLPYIDIKIAGTVSGTGYYLTTFETGTGITVAEGSQWYESAFVALVGGSLTNINTIRLNINHRQADGTYIGEASGSNIKDSLTADLQRFSLGKTYGDTTPDTARSTPGITIEGADTTAIDITIRIAAPQMELGAFASSPILTTSAAVTRAADVGSITDLDTKSWFNAAESTLLVRFTPAAVPPASQFVGVVSIDNGTAANRVNLIHRHTTAVVRIELTEASVSSAALGTGTAAAATPCKVAATYSAAGAAISQNGAAVEVDSVVTVPTGLTTLSIGAGTGVSPYFGVVNSLTYYPNRFVDTTLRSLST